MAEDPNFPKRPQTPEFEALSKIALMLDHSEGPQEFLSDDEIYAVDYMGTNRSGIAVGVLTGCSTIAELRMNIMLGQVSIAELMRVVYIDAFLMGKHYGEELS